MLTISMITLIGTNAVCFECETNYCNGHKCNQSYKHEPITIHQKNLKFKQKDKNRRSYICSAFDTDTQDFLVFKSVDG